VTHSTDTKTAQAKLDILRAVLSQPASFQPKSDQYAEAVGYLLHSPAEILTALNGKLPQVAIGLRPVLGIHWHKGYHDIKPAQRKALTYTELWCPCPYNWEKDDKKEDRPPVSRGWIVTVSEDVTVENRDLIINQGGRTHRFPDVIQKGYELGLFLTPGYQGNLLTSGDPVPQRFFAPLNDKELRFEISSMKKIMEQQLAEAKGKR